MEVVLLKILVSQVSASLVTAQFGKHVYVKDFLSWSEAQTFCREHYTDLSPITTRWEENELKNATEGEVWGNFWIGLYLNQSQWMWSGGGAAKNISWAPGQPDGKDDPAAILCWRACGFDGWHDLGKSGMKPFLCINFIVVESRKSWEEAMDYCRMNHTALTSLVSETENLLAQQEIQHDHITDQVWIGVRYLGDRWMWVNGDPPLYEAWSTGAQDPQCPIQNRCGALSKAGLWEAVDCEVKLNFICY